MNKYITTDGLEVGLQIAKSYIDAEVGMKQPVLVSGENIKTINGESILVGGDITIPIPDWSANSINEGYIKNRTHYAVLTTGLQTLTISSSQLNTNISEVYTDVDFMMNGIVYNTLSVLNKDIFVNAQAGGVATVVQSGSQYYLQFTEVYGFSITFEVCNRVSVQQLSEAYIPNTIARISDFKTINGQSLIGSGDIEVGKTNYVELSGASVTISSMLENTFYYDTTPLTSLTISAFTSSGNPKDEYKAVFKAANGMSLTLPSDIYWANGIIPEIEADVLYELSIERSLDIYKAVLVPFKSV